MKHEDFKQIKEYLYEIPQSYRTDMRVPARFYANPELLEAMLQDKSLEQLVNTATLPGVVNYVLAMPDIHQGYGFPIGGVVATELPDGIISPGGVGYDINCGVRLLATHLRRKEVDPYLDDLAEEAPLAYKDVDRVIEVVHGASIAKKLARLRPVVVIKG